MRRNLRSYLRVIAPAAATAALLVGAAACNGDAPTTSSSPAPSVSADAREAERRAFYDLVNDGEAYQAAIERGDLRVDLIRCAPERRQS